MVEIYLAPEQSWGEGATTFLYKIKGKGKRSPLPLIPKSSPRYSKLSYFWHQEVKLYVCMRVYTCLKQYWSSLQFVYLI